jgi:hypothetical protein
MSSRQREVDDKPFGRREDPPCSTACSVFAEVGRVKD